jgi:hypothetical protein
MKKALTYTLAIASLAFATSAKVDAATITNELTQTVSSSGTDFSFPKFDSTQGALTGVFLTIVSSGDGGVVLIGQAFLRLLPPTTQGMCLKLGSSGLS